jgi:hypothetical protein
VDVKAEEVHVFVSDRHGRLPCPTCGASCLVEDHVEERVWRHLDLSSNKGHTLFFCQCVSRF